MDETFIAAQTEVPPPENNPPQQPSLARAAIRWLREALETILPAIAIAILINLFLAQPTRVHGQSMEPNLHTDQRLVVEKITYHLHGPRRGDIVVFALPEQSEEMLIKRVIGLPGETVEIHDGQVFIDGVPLNEPYLTQDTRGRYGPVTVPPLHVFVLGDNRSFSNDSRAFDTVPIANIVGRAWLSYWPMEALGILD
ncbi:MAG: signal peptidase I [Chloroflexota bacterium]